MEKILWKRVRDKTIAWKHVITDIAGDQDICVCTICKVGVELETEKRSRQSILREFTRKHFYKHKIWEHEELLPEVPFIGQPRLF